jgi:hypothetical protein
MFHKKSVSLGRGINISCFCLGISLSQGININYYFTGSLFRRSMRFCSSTPLFCPLLHDGGSIGHFIHGAWMAASPCSGVDGDGRKELQWRWRRI